MSAGNMVEPAVAPGNVESTTGEPVVGDTVTPEAANGTWAIRLEDGRAIAVREIHPADSLALQRFHSRLSQDSIYQRFFEFKPRLSHDMLRYLTHIDGVNRHALVALDPTNPSEIIGVVRYDREPNTSRAEYSAIIEDRWQGHGICHLMSLRLLEDARRNGIRDLYAFVLPENQTMLLLLQNVAQQLEVPVRQHLYRDYMRVDIDLG